MTISRQMKTTWLVLSWIAAALLQGTFAGTSCAQGTPKSGAKKADAGASTDGWTKFEARPGATTIHVAADGDDKNPGTEARPKATIGAGYEALRDGRADALLLRRGDRWVLPKLMMWSKSGPKEEGAGWMRLGAYGDEALPRPIVENREGDAIHLTPGFRSDQVVTNVAFTDVHFLASDHLTFPKKAASVSCFMLLAVQWQGAGKPLRNVLFENIKIQGFEAGIVSGSEVENLHVRRSVFTEIFSPGGQGASASAIMTQAQGLLLDENVFFRIQHPDLPGVTAVSHFAHSAYVGAGATDVVSRGNFVLKATEGILQRPGGIYERNVLAENDLACMFGQAYGVPPTRDGVEATVRENLFLDNRTGFSLGNTRGGTFSHNLLLSSQKASTSQDLTLIGRNAQSGGYNIGVHGVVFADNFLSGKIAYMGDEKAAENYSRLTFQRNSTGMSPSKSVGEFLRSVGIEGKTMSDYGEALVARDRKNFGPSLRTTGILNFYRKAVGLPDLTQ